MHFSLHRPIGLAVHRPSRLVLSLATLGLAALALGSLTAVPAQAQIQNGSFEQGTFVNNGQGFESLNPGSTAITNWTTTNIELAWVINANSSGIVTPYGSYFLDLTGAHDTSPYGGVTQTISTTSGNAYHFSFSLGADHGIGTYAGTVSAIASAGGTSQTFTFTPLAGTTGTQWGTFGFDFIATGATTPITITGASTQSGTFLGLDNVSVTSNAPVPEASTTVSLGLLLTLGMGGLVVAGRRKKA